MKEDEGLDRISAMMAEESAALRKRTLFLSLIPIVVGAAVVITAYYGVADARSRRDALLAEMEELYAVRDQLSEEVDQQKAVSEHLKEKLPEEERTAADLVQTGLDAYNTDNFEVAVQKLESAIALDPTNMAEAHYRLGLSLWRTGKNEQALEQVKTAFKIDPSYQEKARQDRRFKELWDYSEFVEGQQSASNQGEAEAIKGALQAAKTGKFDEAVSSYDAALATNPDNAKVLNWKGFALYRQGKYEEAVTSYKRCIEIDPKVAECYYNLGLALWQTGDKKGAQRAFERTWQLEPSFEGKARQDPAYRKIAVELNPRLLDRKDKGS